MILLSCNSKENIKPEQPIFGSSFQKFEDKITDSIRRTLNNISLEISNSDSIDKCKSGIKLLNAKKAALPQLLRFFKETYPTTIYSKRNNRFLTNGELAIIMAEKIEHPPTALVYGIQVCMPHYLEIETYLGNFNRQKNEICENYKKWLDEEIGNKQLTK